MVAEILNIFLNTCSPLRVLEDRGEGTAWRPRAETGAPGRREQPLQLSQTRCFAHHVSPPPRGHSGTAWAESGGLLAPDLVGPQTRRFASVCFRIRRRAPIHHSSPPREFMSVRCKKLISLTVFFFPSLKQVEHC